MKKFYLLLTALLVAGAAHANLTFYIDGKPIEPNTTITFNEISKEFVGEWLVEMKPNLSIQSDIYTSKLSVTATCVTGQSIQMCTGGACQTGTSVKKTDIKVSANQPLPLEFHYEGSFASETEIPTDIKVHFEAQDGNKQNTYIAYDLIMNTEQASITLIESNAKPVRYTAAGLEYNLDGNANIALYDITGRQVLNVNAEGQGTVNTHTLHTGLYLYSVRTATGAKQTGKIYVK